MTEPQCTTLARNDASTAMSSATSSANGERSDADSIAMNGVMSKFAALEQQVKDIMSVVEVQQKISTLEERVKGASTASDLLKYLLLFWAALSGVLGFFGWRQFSNMTDLVNRVVHQQLLEQLPESQRQFGEFKRLVADAQQVGVQLDELTKNYRTKLDQLKLSTSIVPNMDIEGELLKLGAEVDKRYGTSDLLDLKWRAEAIGVIQRFADATIGAAFPADFIFNVVQDCRRLHMVGLADRLTKSAVKSSNDPAIRAMSFALTIETSSSPQDRENAMNELLKMVTNLPRKNAEIVLAEAWNGSEELGRYDVLAKALEETPLANAVSYTYVILARCYLRGALPGCVEKAKDAISRADALLKKESTMSTWYNATAREARQLRPHLVTPKLARPNEDGTALDLASLMKAIRKGEEASPDVQAVP